MRSYCAVYVDVGYLLSSAATRVTGSSLRRGIVVDHAALIERIVAQVEADSGLPLLRVNWYDSGARPGGMPDIHQEEIGMLPRVKLRLGRLSYSGDQKGVDLRIGLDLATHGRNRVADVCYLVSGDDDLTEAVEEAQGHGVQVVILAVPGRNGRAHGVAKHLQREADATLLLDADAIDATVHALAIPEGLLPAEQGEPEPDVAPEEPAAAQEPTPATGPEPTARSASGSGRRPGAPSGHPSSDATEEVLDPAASGPTPSVLARKRATSLTLPGTAAAPAVPAWTTSTGDPPRPDGEDATPDDLIDAVAKQVVASWCASATPEMLVELKRDRPTVPSDLDRALLMDLSARSGVYDIDDPSRHELRDRFWFHVGRVRMG